MVSRNFATALGASASVWKWSKNVWVSTLSILTASCNNDPNLPPLGGSNQIAVKYELAAARCLPISLCAPSPVETTSRKPFSIKYPSNEPTHAQNGM
jgi:hypothetical protein